ARSGLPARSLRARRARRCGRTCPVLPGSARRCSVDPGWVYEDAVAAVWAIGADGDQLEAVVSGFERPHCCGVDANDIPAAELADLVVESDLSGAADDDVCLLLFAVAIRRSTPGLQARFAAVVEGRLRWSP